jgi:peptide/nickel transport system substrate-binding protein
MIDRNKPNVFLAFLILSLALSNLGLLGHTHLVKAQELENIPRGDILIIGGEVNRKMNPYDFNDMRPGGWTWNIATDTLYSENQTGEMGLPYYIFPLLAESLPQYDSDYKKLRISLRKGIYWSDGVEFTAEDVVFTVKLYNSTPGSSAFGEVNKNFESIIALDKYTIEITLKAPNPKFHTATLLSLGILPEHIWKNVSDPLAFNFYPPVGTGPYVLKDVDPNGYWMLWERREDWQRSSSGVILGEKGKPKPKYILAKCFETEEKKYLAFARNELDWDVLSYTTFIQLRNVNPYVRSMYDSFPYRWAGGNSDHGIAFNCEKYPYNITDVRWALALAINMTELEVIALESLARIASFRVASVLSVAPTLEPILIRKIENFSLSDGYKPWDATIPNKIAAYLKSKGISLPAPATEIYGPGWWKYDPEEAAGLLEKHGFYKDSNGRWHLPDGSLWQIELPTTNWVDLVVKLAFGVADQWEKFGVGVSVKTLDSAVYFSKVLPGNFEVCAGWFLTAKMPDFTAGMTSVKYYNEKYYKPIGTAVGAINQNVMRWRNSRVTEILNEMETLIPEDPKIPYLSSEIIEEFNKDMPYINLFIGSKIWTVNQYVWKNWPTAENPYWTIYPRPGSAVRFALPHLIPTGNVQRSESEYEILEREDIQKVINSVKQNMSDITASISALREKVSAQESLLNATIAIAIIDLLAVVAIIAVIFLRKR